MTQALMPHSATALVSFAESDRKIELLAETIMKGASLEELTHFANVCQHTGLDPFRKQIYAIKRWDGQLKREVWTFQISIDGFRLIAQQSGGYLGQQGPLWCGPDGQWREMWLAKEPPSGCVVRVFRQGWPLPVEGKATYSEYVQLDRDGKPNSMWRKMPANQLAKCAEAQALRKAFSQTLQAIQAAAPQYAITVEDPDPDEPAPDEPAPARPQLAAPAPSVQAPRRDDAAGTSASAARAPESARGGGATAKATALADSATPAQLTTIATHLQRTGRTPAAVLDELDVPSFEALSRTEASALLRELTKLPNAGAAATLPLEAEDEGEPTAEELAEAARLLRDDPTPTLA